MERVQSMSGGKAARKRGTMKWFGGLSLLCSSATVDGLLELVAEYFFVGSRVLLLDREGGTNVYHLKRTDGGKTAGIVVMKNKLSGSWQARFDDKD